MLCVSLTCVEFILCVFVHYFHERVHVHAYMEMHVGMFTVISVCLCAYVCVCVCVCVCDADQIVIFSSSELASLLKQRFLSPIQDHSDQPSAFNLCAH